MVELPKSWFVHTVIYKRKSDSVDNWDVPEVQSVKVTGVRVSAPSQTINISTQGAEDTSKAKLFVHPSYSSFNEFKEQGTITFDGKSYKIRSVKTYRWHNKNKVHHWELELI